MAKVLKKVAFTIEIDEDAIAPASPEVFMYQMMNRLGYEHGIQSISLDDVTVLIKSKLDLYNLPIGEDKTLDGKPLKANILLR